MNDMLFVFAIGPEIEDIIKKTDHKRLISKKNMALYSCMWGQKTFLLLKTGVGQSNATIALTLVLETFPIKEVCFMGFCGGLHDGLNTGDIVIADKVVQFDSFQSFDHKKKLLKPGVASFKEDIHKKPHFALDCTKIHSLLKNNHRFTIQVGTFLSGSEFVCSNQRKKELRESIHEALAVDMEAAGIIAASRFFDVELSVLKVVADGVDHSAGILNEFKSNIPRSQEILTALFFEICQSNSTHLEQTNL